ncbi:MAG: hypothetical protein ACYCT1_08555 [Steroidobacteraceae bacterium]
MVELAVDIVAFCIVAAAVVAALAVLGAIWISFGQWLEVVPGRPRRFWSTLGTVFAVLVLLAWYSLSPSGLAAAGAWIALTGVAVALCMALDRLGWRWKVAAVWLTWGALVLGLIAVVLHGEGRLP